MSRRRASSPRRSSSVFVALVAASALLTIPGAQPVQAAIDRLPDMQMARLTDFRIQTSNGRRLLRFSAMMTNLGSGPLVVSSTRASTSSPWRVDQVINDTAGGSRRVPTAATMMYGGDGHGHWHVERMVDTDLWTTGRNGKGAKIGFCFFDTTAINLSLPGAPRGPVYREAGCPRQSGLTSTMGISVGWGDRYQWSLPFQWVDITGMPGGTYTIRSWVDGGSLFAESSNANNCSYARIRFASSGSGVTVLASGSACVNDYSGSVHAADMRWAMESGIMPPCGLDLFCPGVLVTRGQTARWVDRTLRLPGTANDYFTDDAGNRDEGSINRLAAAGFAIGCGPSTYCPSAAISRADLAATLARAWALPAATIDYYTDDSRHALQADINRVTQAKIMFECGPRLFCPHGAVTRGAFAAYLHRAAT